MDYSGAILVLTTETSIIEQIIKAWKSNEMFSFEIRFFGLAWDAWHMFCFGVYRSFILDKEEQVMMNKKIWRSLLMIWFLICIKVTRMWNIFCVGCRINFAHYISISLNRWELKRLKRWWCGTMEKFGYQKKISVKKILRNGKWKTQRLIKE